jgi:penicillin-binding protein 1A
MPDTVVDDLPWGDGTGWDPRNADGQFDGPITVREGLARSKNMVSIRLLAQVGVDAARAWAGRFGFDVERQPDNLTLALGAGSTTPLQLACAYAVFANGGFRVAPVLIERITDAQGRAIYEAPPPAPLTEENRAVPARNVFIVDSLLNDVTRIGTAARAQAELKRPDLFGKTGTTNDAVDAWFAGFQGSVVGVAWMGHDEPRSLGEGESGGGLALPIWIGAMAPVLRGVPVQMPEPPDGVTMGATDWRYAEWAESAPVERIGGGSEPPR